MDLIYEGSPIWLVIINWIVNNKLCIIYILQI